MRAPSGKARWLPLAYGLLFATGLALSGMAQPAKVLGFLDITGRWDPSLAFVMVGAVGVYAFTQRRLARWPAPILADRFSQPTQRRIDVRLIVGAAIFGVGWGLSGFCPGPALSSFGAGTHAALWFVPALVVGTWLHDRVWRRERS